jgi:CRP/FNR family nitrogen fixation transcriptional regulator
MQAQTSFQRRTQPTSPATPDEAVKLIGAARSFSRDQEVFGEGEPADAIYRVASGVVRSFRILADGRRQIADFYLPGDIFGVEAGQRRQATAEAVSDATLIVARRSSLVGSEGQESWGLWRLAMDELARSQEHVLTLGRRSASERVASFLLSLAERLGAGDVVEVPMSRQDIADYLGLTIETVSRTLTQLQADGVLEVRGCRQIRFADRGALEKLRQ